MNKKKNVAFIFARGGSKGIKDKNICLLNNKPLISYTIEAAISSKIFDASNLPFATQLRATPPERQRYFNPVSFLRDLASLRIISSVTT